METKIIVKHKKNDACLQTNEIFLVSGNKIEKPDFPIQSPTIIKSEKQLLKPKLLTKFASLTQTNFESLCGIKFHKSPKNKIKQKRKLGKIGYSHILIKKDFIDLSKFHEPNNTNSLNKQFQNFDFYCSKAIIPIQKFIENTNKKDKHNNFNRIIENKTPTVSRNSKIEKSIDLSKHYISSLKKSASPSALEFYKTMNIGDNFKNECAVQVCLDNQEFERHEDTAEKLTKIINSKYNDHMKTSINFGNINKSKPLIKKSILPELMSQNLLTNNLPSIYTTQKEQTIKSQKLQQKLAGSSFLNKFSTLLSYNEYHDEGKQISRLSRVNFSLENLFPIKYSFKFPKH